MASLSWHSFRVSVLMRWDQWRRGRQLTWESDEGNEEDTVIDPLKKWSEILCDWILVASEMDTRDIRTACSQINQWKRAVGGGILLFLSWIGLWLFFFESLEEEKMTSEWLRALLVNLLDDPIPERNSLFISISRFHFIPSVLTEIVLDN